jgi:hypothetical protein
MCARRILRAISVLRAAPGSMFSSYQTETLSRRQGAYAVSAGRLRLDTNILIFVVELNFEMAFAVFETVFVAAGIDLIIFAVYF